MLALPPTPLTSKLQRLVVRFAKPARVAETAPVVPLPAAAIGVMPIGAGGSATAFHLAFVLVHGIGTPVSSRQSSCALALATFARRNRARRMIRMGTSARKGDKWGGHSAPFATASDRRRERRSR